jgi:hypothetical protein
MNTLYIAWQDPDTRGWLPVARLIYKEGVYRFEYTKGAKNTRFVPFGRLKELNQVYYSHELFPLFANRLLTKSRPEYQTYLKWLGVGLETQDPMLLLARSGGVRGTDLLEVFPQPEANAQGEYELYFFSHGLRHQSRETLARINGLTAGETLDLTPDDENPVDSFAIVLHTGDRVKAGFCPRYLAPDLRRLLNSGADWRLTVARVNADAPIQFRLLCKLVFKLPEGVVFFAGEDFKPVSEGGDFNRDKREI